MDCVILGKRFGEVLGVDSEKRDTSGIGCLGVDSEKENTFRSGKSSE